MKTDSQIRLSYVSAVKRQVQAKKFDDIKVIRQLQTNKHQKYSIPDWNYILHVQKPVAKQHLMASVAAAFFKSYQICLEIPMITKV